jgi:hemerythrin-like metal-binding protein
MAILEWDPSYSVGVAALDEDHKRLISVINRVTEAESRGEPVQWVLQELDEYAQGHFRREEERLEEVNFPGLEAHRAEHASFVEWLSSLKTTYSLDPEAHFHLAKTVEDFLRSWLQNHILTVDMQYKGEIS